MYELFLRCDELWILCKPGKSSDALGAIFAAPSELCLSKPWSQVTPKRGSNVSNSQPSGPLLSLPTLWAFRPTNLPVFDPQLRVKWRLRGIVRDLEEQCSRSTHACGCQSFDFQLRFEKRLRGFELTDLCTPGKSSFPLSYTDSPAFAGALGFHFW